MKIILSKTYKKSISIDRNEENIWICPECMFGQDWTYQDLMERGTPVCPNCDIDMEPPQKSSV